jgi:hypothetical protein
MYRVENAKCTRQTEKAILVEAPGFDEPQWIPQSVVHDDSEVYEKDGEGTLIIEDWFANEKGWL